MPTANAYHSPWATDDVEMFRRTVRQFVHNEFTPFQARWRTQHGPDREAWRAAGRAGVLLPDVAGEFGGGDGTYAHEAVVQDSESGSENRVQLRSASPLQALGLIGQVGHVGVGHPPHSSR